MLSAISLGSNKKISRIIYKNPIVECGSKVIFDNLNTIQYYNRVKIFIELNKIKVEATHQMHNIENQSDEWCRHCNQY